MTVFIERELQTANDRLWKELAMIDNLRAAAVARHRR